MLLLQSIARDDVQQSGTSFQSWSEFFAKWVGWPLGPLADVQTSVEETGTSRMKGMAISGREQQARVQMTALVNNGTFEVQTLSQRLLEVTAELHRIKVELIKAKNANGNLQMEKTRLEQEKNMLRGSMNWRQDYQTISRRPPAFDHTPNLAGENDDLKMKNADLESRIAYMVKELHGLRMKNANLESRIASMVKEPHDLRMKNADLESRIASMIKDFQQVHKENEVLQSLQYAAEMTDIHRRDLYQIRRRIIIEKMTKVLGNRYGHRSKRESFDNWSRRVRYPGWERMVEVAMRAIRQGNKVAHRATRAELQAACDDEGEYPEEAEVFQRMLDIVYNGGEIGEDDDINDEYNDDNEWWS